MNPVRDLSGALNTTGIILKSKSGAEQRGIISNGVKSGLMPTCDLEVKIGKMTLMNPVIVSSGTFGFGEEFKDFIDLIHLGAIIP